MVQFDGHAYPFQQYQFNRPAITIELNPLIHKYQVNQYYRAKPTDSQKTGI